MEGKMDREVEKEKIIRSIFGSLEGLIAAQVNGGNDLALVEITNTVGLLLYYAGAARKLDLSWAEYAELVENQENPDLKPASWRTYLGQLDPNVTRSLH